MRLPTLASPVRSEVSTFRTFRGVAPAQTECHCDATDCGCYPGSGDNLQSACVDALHVAMNDCPAAQEYDLQAGGCPPQRPTH
jgi:hypothetical protein